MTTIVRSSDILTRRLLVDDKLLIDGGVGEAVREQRVDVKVEHFVDDVDRVVLVLQAWGQHCAAARQTFTLHYIDHSRA